MSYPELPLSRKNNFNMMPTKNTPSNLNVYKNKFLNTNYKKYRNHTMTNFDRSDDNTSVVSARSNVSTKSIR